MIGLILAIGILFTKNTGTHQYGDGTTYYLMVESFVKDKNLILDNKEITRWKLGEWEEDVNKLFGVYVMVDKKGMLRFAEPILYPLLMAPFFLFLANTGFVLLNGLFLGGGIAFGYLFLRQYFNVISALLIVLMFFFSSFIPIYTAWIHPEIMLFFACSLCMWLWLAKKKLGFAALIIGIVSSARIVFLLLLVPVIIALVVKKEFKQLSKAIGMCFLGIVLMLILTFLFTGRFFPSAGGLSYIGTALSPSLSIDEIKATLINDPFNFFQGVEFQSWGLFFRNLFNFFIGRFSGIIWYAFPGMVCVIFYLLRRKRLKNEEKITGDSILLTMLLLVVVLIMVKPLNYYGGGGFICNRHFFILPALLFLPALNTFRNFKKVFFVFLLGLIVNFHIFKFEISDEDKIFYNRKYPHTSSPGVFTCVFPLRYLPLEFFQIETFPVDRVKVSDNIYLYFPLGVRKRIGKRSLVDKGGEIVIVQKNGQKYIKIQTDHREIILPPKLVLKSRKGTELRSFYYLKVADPLWVNDVFAVNY